MSSDKILIFEENNWDRLADKFIRGNQDNWETFVLNEFENNQPDPEDDPCFVDDSAQIGDF